jgi:hypothetical protein
MMPEGIVRADERGRVAIGRYTEDAAGKYFRIVRQADGSLDVREVSE